LHGCRRRFGNYNWIIRVKGGARCFRGGTSMMGLVALRRLLSGSAVAAALFTAAHAQDAPIIRVSVDRIQIGAVVTDAKGRHVTDLGLGDFTVLDGGKPQRVTSCEYIRLGNAPTPVSASATGHREHLSRGFVEHVKGRENARSAGRPWRSASPSAISGGLQYFRRQALVRSILQGRPPICQPVAPRPTQESRRSAFRSGGEGS
jgi:hypothetical protein